MIALSALILVLVQGSATLASVPDSGRHEFYVVSETASDMEAVDRATLIRSGDNATISELSLHKLSSDHATTGEPVLSLWTYGFNCENHKWRRLDSAFDDLRGGFQSFHHGAGPWRSLEDNGSTISKIAFFACNDDATGAERIVGGYKAVAARYATGAHVHHWWQPTGHHRSPP